MYTTEQLSEGVKALKFCRDSAVKLSDETIAGLVYDYMAAINRPVTQAEGDAKNAWAAGFKAGNDWKINKVGSYYGQGNFGNQPEQPANPYAAIANKKATQ